MNTEEMNFVGEVRKNKKSPFGDFLRLFFGLTLLLYGKDIVEVIWSTFHLPF
jgi:hypothetical protein